MKKFLLPLLLIGCALSGAITTQAQSNYEPYPFATFAGKAGVPGSSDGGDGDARFHSPNGVAVDSAGNVYVADTLNHTIREITPAGVVSTLAGRAGVIGSSDGTGSAALFNFPRGVAVDSAGNVYVADTLNHTIRKITPAGVVSTLAGLAGISGSADGTGSAARFNQPADVAVDSAGNAYVADAGNHTIRKITPAGVVSTLAGLAGNFGSTDGTGSAARFFGPEGVAVDSAGNVYVGDTSNHTIRKITPSGVVSTLAGLAGSTGTADGTGSAARFNYPKGLAVDNAGNVYVADRLNNTIRKITPSGVVSTLAGLAGSTGSADGTGSAARFFGPGGVAVDSAGNVYVGDSANHTIRKITPTRLVSTLAGLPGTIGSADGTGGARFSFPQGVAIDTAGNLYVADSNNNTIRKITSIGLVGTLAGSAGNSGSANGMGGAARFNSPIGVAVDSGGNVYVGDTFNNTIRKITPDGVVTTLAGLAGISGTADGTGSTARFNLPTGVAVDGAGNVYVADAGNHTIRKITPVGVVSTLAGLPGTIGSADGTGSAARFNSPFGVAVDNAGNAYVADTGNNTFRKITPAGAVTTLAGLPGSAGSADGTGSAARFNAPQGVGVDSAGNIYVGDTNNNTIRKITPAGVVTTLGGLAGSTGSADGIGSAARFAGPRGVAVESANNLFVADTNNHTIRLGGTLFITSPLVATATFGVPFVYQFETIGATSLSVSNPPPGLTFNASLSAITGTLAAAGTFQVGLTASNAQHTATAILTITGQTAPATGPVIISSTGATGRAGQPFSFQVITTGGTPAARVSVNALPPGLILDPVAGLISGTPAAEGSSAVTLTVTDGSFSTSSTLQLTITSDPARPLIVSPSSALLTPGRFFTYTITADANGTFGYMGTDGTTHQGPFPSTAGLPPGLSFDGIDTISGTFNPPFGHDGGPRRISGLSGGIVTNVQLFATDPSGTGTFPLIFFLKAKGAVEISTRMAVGTGDNVLIGGFIIDGTGTTKVLIRAIGPSLTGFVSNALQDPMLELHAGPLTLGSNDNWRDSQRNPIIATGIPPTDDHESAILAYLSPGAYTAIVRGKNNTTGIALVEVYDLGTAGLNTSAKLGNISTRGFVDTGDNVMIGGFIIDVPATRVVIRAIGPSLSAFGVSGALQDPTVALKDANGATLIGNDNWQDNPMQAAEIQQRNLAPTDPRESALVTTLPPGLYTAIVRGKNNTTGLALVEVYALPGL